MFRFVLFIFLFFGSSTAFASDDVSKLGIIERLQKIEEEKNAAILLPNKPFGISLGSKFSPLSSEVLGQEASEYYLTLNIIPKKLNSIFDEYSVITSQDEMLVFHVNAASKTRHASLETCIEEKDKLFKILFRKYSLGSYHIDVPIKGSPFDQHISAFATKWDTGDNSYHYKTMLICQKDGSGDMRLHVSYMDLLLFSEVVDEHEASLISNM